MLVEVVGGSETYGNPGGTGGAGGGGWRSVAHLLVLEQDLMEQLIQEVVVAGANGDSAQPVVLLVALV
jgi:hypothetical protein